MAAFAERLRNFDQEIAKGNGDRRGLLLPHALPGVPPGGRPGRRRRPAALAVADVRAGGVRDRRPGDGFGFPSRAISGLEMSLLGIEKPEGGVSGISLRAPNGTVYGLGIRPLLPDEQR